MRLGLVVVGDGPRGQGSLGVAFPEVGLHEAIDDHVGPPNVVVVPRAGDHHAPLEEDQALDARTFSKQVLKKGLCTQCERGQVSYEGEAFITYLAW